MAGLTMAALAVAAEVATLPVREPLAPPPEPAFRVAVETVEVGDGSALVTAGAGYAAGRSHLSLSASWRRTGYPGWPDVGELSLAVGRDLRRGERLDLSVWRGLNRFSGGTGVGLTWSRPIGLSR